VPDPGWVATPRYVADRSDGFASIGFPTEPDIERILALEPDLIIGIGLDGLSEEAIATLAEVAPAVVLERISGSQARWRDTFRAFADVLACRPKPTDGWSATNSVSRRPRTA
jgi:ABC-type Fe3+-hydroxamate transport system substrate-binding protein